MVNKGNALNLVYVDFTPPPNAFHIIFINTLKISTNVV